VFGIVGLLGLISGNLMSLLTLVIAALIIYTSVFQLGGWPAVKQDINLFLIAHKFTRKQFKAKKRKGKFKVIK
jgi:hypothetical protein